MEVILVISAIFFVILAAGIWEARRDAAKENRVLTIWQSFTGGIKCVYYRILDAIAFGNW